MNKKNLLVTGGCGFIGSNFINYIFPKGFYKIYNVDTMYYCANEANIDEAIRQSLDYKLITVNTRCQHIINYILNAYEIDYVIHFAAQSHVQTSFDDSLQYTMDNILGTHTLLETCRIYGKIKKFIHVSTDEVYGESSVSENMKTEQSVLCPTNPYAATKAGAELISQAYYHSYKFPVIITRGNNVYGPNQYPEKIVPKFLNQLLHDKKVTIQGKGDTVRAFLHAFDTARAFECILEKGIIGEIYNIGSEEELSVMEVAEKLITKLKKTDNIKDWIEYIDDRPFNDKRYYISCKKLQDLGWFQTIFFNEGIDKLITYEKNK